MNNEIKKWEDRYNADEGNDPITMHMEREIAELRARIESLAADAGRLDKLEEIMARTDSGAHIFSHGKAYEGESMREVLDLVIAKEKA